MNKEISYPTEIHRRIADLKATNPDHPDIIPGGYLYLWEWNYEVVKAADSINDKIKDKKPTGEELDKLRVEIRRHAIISGVLTTIMNSIRTYEQKRDKKQNSS